MTTSAFKPALIIVDLQEDFCPPNGSLAVPLGREIVPIINDLLHLPWTIRIATKDWHPQDHISFASNHVGKKAFVDFVTVINPRNEEERYESRLWPDHCIQNTFGAEIVAELDVEKVDVVIEKGTRREVEMYSAFYDPLREPRVSDSGLKGILEGKGVTDVFCVGLAFDYCVKFTAIDAGMEGFRTWVVGEGTRAVDGAGWGEVVTELEGRGVKVVSLWGEEVGRVRSFGA